VLAGNENPAVARRTAPTKFFGIDIQDQCDPVRPTLSSSGLRAKKRFNEPPTQISLRASLG
jgi:hypothetical protein